METLGGPASPLGRMFRRIRSAPVPCTTARCVVLFGSSFFDFLFEFFHSGRTLLPPQTDIETLSLPQHRQSCRTEPGGVLHVELGCRRVAQVHVGIRVRVRATATIVVVVELHIIIARVLVVLKIARTLVTIFFVLVDNGRAALNVRMRGGEPVRVPATEEDLDARTHAEVLDISHHVVPPQLFLVQRVLEYGCRPEVHVVHQMRKRGGVW